MRDIAANVFRATGRGEFKLDGGGCRYLRTLTKFGRIVSYRIGRSGRDLLTRQIDRDIDAEAAITTAVGHNGGIGNAIDLAFAVGICLRGA